MDLLHEHRSPEILFSVSALSQLQFSAFCLPQEHCTDHD